MQELRDLIIGYLEGKADKLRQTRKACKHEPEHLKEAEALKLAVDSLPCLAAFPSYVAVRHEAETLLGHMRQDLQSKLVFTTMASYTDAPSEDEARKFLALLSLTSADTLKELSQEQVDEVNRICYLIMDYIYTDKSHAVAATTAQVHHLLVYGDVLHKMVFMFRGAVVDKFRVLQRALQFRAGCVLSKAYCDLLGNSHDQQLLDALLPALNDADIALTANSDEVPQEIAEVFGMDAPEPEPAEDSPTPPIVISDSVVLKRFEELLRGAKMLVANSTMEVAKTTVTTMDTKRNELATVQHGMRDGKSWKKDLADDAKMEEVMATAKLTYKDSATGVSPAQITGLFNSLKQARPSLSLAI